MNNKLLFGIMYNDKEKYNQVLNELTKKYGELEKTGKEYDFTKFTNYYEKEMGKNITKILIFFKKTIKETDLIEIKNHITELEKKYFINNKRTVNIDPGYISDKRIVLASYKQKDFKKDLGQGVYAHEIISFKNGNKITYWHTFSDYINNIK